jgi:alpha-glucosidase
VVSRQHHRRGGPRARRSALVSRSWADYVAEIYRDGAEADWQERPLDIEITSVLVDSSTQMSLRLAPAGGQAIRFRPATDEETNSLSRYGQED